MLPEPNVLFWIILAGAAALYALELLSSLLNLRALDPRLPAEFADVLDPAKYARSQEYTRCATRLGLLESSASLAAFLLFWLLGGFPWLDGTVRSFSAGPVMAGVSFAALLHLARHLLFLPFGLYDTFVIESRFGFNRTTLRTWILDELKGLALFAAIGLPLFALLIFIFERLELAWVFAWIAVCSSSLALTYLAPRFILPLFNRFSPLPDGELKEAIREMARQCDFPFAEVTVMDGSKRSTKSNAFFTGFGRNKKIALFDTIVASHTTAELVAILAHEIAHHRKKHIIQRAAFGVLQAAVLLYLLNLFLDHGPLFAAFGVREPSVYLGFYFFAVLFKPVSEAVSVALSAWSRKNEYQADAFARATTGDAESLMSALKKLARDNLLNLTPHPLHVFLNHSHPPLLERVAALRRGQA